VRLEALKDVLKGLAEGLLKSKSTEYIEFEQRERENIFSLLLVGSFIGLPSPPSNLSMRLLPYIAREMYVMGSRARDLDDVSGEVFGLFAD
jgi:hypothetical protein